MAIRVKSKGRSSFDQFWRNIPIIGGLLLFLVIFYIPAGAQEQQTLQPNQVQGSVLGAREPSEPLIGVSVQVLGQTKGTVTDAKGHYEIAASRGDTLIFSYIGYDTKNVVVEGKNELNVVMQPATSGLHEVVVVGYGTQKKIDVTGAVSSISGKDLETSPSFNITNSLAGRLPGVIAVNPNGSPGSGSNFTIRGLGSLNDNSPLVVIDGIVRNDFSQIDPADIASITILKDASAAVYGARAANGVFLITTKHGTIGKPVITYTADFGIQQPTLYPKVMSALQYATAHNDALLNQGYDPTNPAQAPQFYSQKQLADYKSGRDGSDWYGLTFKNSSFVTHHNLTMTGGSKNIRYFASAGYVDQDGMYDHSNFKRYNFRTNIDANINKNLVVTLQLNGRQQKYSAPGYDANYIFFITKVQDPTRAAFYKDGRPRNTTGAHPWAMIHQSGYSDNTDNIFNGTLSFTQQLPFITAGLSLSGNASWHKEYDFNKKFFTPYTMYDEDSSGNITGTKVVDAPTTLNESYQQMYSSTYNVSLQYEHSFNSHHVKGLLLAEQSEGQGDNLNGSKADFPSNIKDQLFASGSTNQTISGYGILSDSRQSVVGRFNYDYANKYLFEIAFRYDGSYKFPKGKRFGFFPDISAGWNIAEESFIKDNPKLSFINNLKLRASQGLLGNDRVSAFQYEESYTLQSGAGPVFAGSPQTNAYYGVFPNPNITWEKTAITDVGLDGNLWNNLLGFEIDYFFKHTHDILWTQVRSIPSTFGRSLPSVNYAEMDDKGFEVALTHQNNIGKVQYNISVMASFAVNKVVRIDDPPGAPDYLKQLGKPVGFRAGYRALGIFQSDEQARQWFDGTEFGESAKAGDIKYADVDGDGVITSNDQIVLSDNNGTPKIMFGLSLGATWNNFNLNFLIQGAAKSNLMLTGRGRVMFSNSYFNTFTYLLDYWSKDNTGAKYPQAWVNSRSINDRDSNIWLKKNGYGRLKSAQLGYTFNRQWLKGIGIEKLKVYFSGFNLLTISQLKIFDPEVENGQGEYYPQQRTLNAGLNLTF